MNPSRLLALLRPSHQTGSNCDTRSLHVTPQETLTVLFNFRAQLACATVAIIAAAIINSPARADTAVTLRYKFKPGETRTYETSGQIGIPMAGMMSAGAAQPKSTGAKPSNFTVPLNSTQRIKV